ncbi:MAG: FAD-dependent oxidoreductase [Faecousia sp.]
MEKKHEVLFTPMQVGGVTVKNRFVHAPMEGTTPIEWMMGYKFNESSREYLIERAKNGIGLIIPGITAVKSVVGGKWMYKQEKLFLGPVKDLMDEIHKYDCKFFLQIGAGFGRVLALPDQLTMLLDKKWLAKLLKVDRCLASPSELPSVWDPKRTCPEMTEEEIEEIIHGFVQAAVLCRKAGIDGVEIHAVHEGYLLDQFTIRNTNHRSGKYGGSLENRARFVTEIIRGIKRECGQDYPVIVRYSVTSKMRGFNQAALPGEKYEEFGRDYEESIRLAQLLEAAGADALDADNGSYDSWFWAHPPMYMPLACNLEDAKFIKQHVHIPVFCAGRMEDPDIASEAVANGDIDGVTIGRQFLADSEYVLKIQESRPEDIRPCIACHNGCFAVAQKQGGGAYTSAWGNGHCALNPRTLNEKEKALKPLTAKKNIAVIGGGIGGMEFARVAALRGHNVTIYEKSHELGGVFIAAAAPSFKEKDKLLLDWYRKQMKDRNVNIVFGCEISEKELDSLKADEIVYAVGATPRTLKIKGAEQALVMDAIDYLRGYKEAGEHIAIIGGGLTGCEIAYDAVLKGKKPVIIEMQNDILNLTTLCAANANMLREIIRYYEIPVYCNAKTVEITDNTVVIEVNGEEITLPVDSVVTSIGYNASKMESKEHLHVIGDAAKVGNLMSVIWAAYDLANSL